MRPAEPAGWPQVRALLETAMASDQAAAAAREQAAAPGASHLAGSSAVRLRRRADTDFELAARAAAAYFRRTDRAAGLRCALARLRSEQADG